MMERETNRAPVNILMVDDQPAKLLSYEAILDVLGENLIKASTPKEVLEHLLKKDIGVVLMDVSMPEMDGFEIADLIRQHPRFGRTAIIFISAIHFTDMDRLLGYQRGAVDYISVPVIPEVLRAKVRIFAELHRKSQELELLNAELRRLSAALITMQDDERRRIARELHDGLGQDLTAAKLMLLGLSRNNSDGTDTEAMDNLHRLLDGAIQQTRNMSYLLHPPLLDEMGLRSALGWYLEGLSNRAGVKAEISFQPVEFPRLAPELETTLFRIIQEALSNVFRHSRATRTSVSLVFRDNSISVTVQDNGVGVLKEVAEFRPERLGVGIGGMRQRVKELGGQIRLRNASPGTIVEIVIPAPAHATKASRLVSEPTTTAVNGH